MGMDSQNEMDKSMLSTEARRKFDELVALLAQEKYGPGPPPIDTTFAEIEDFGRMMAAEADSRGFYQAAKHAFVSDGLPYNWTIQRTHFPGFTPILDFVHAVEHIYAAARQVRSDQAAIWQLHLQWTDACWKGRVEEVISELLAEQQRIGEPPPDAAEKDPRKIIAATIGYFQNNAGRMDYPTYRREGLPVTSALMESFVKELNRRVKGTEKFWNDGPSGDAILQVRAAALYYNRTPTLEWCRGDFMHNGLSWQTTLRNRAGIKPVSWFRAHTITLSAIYAQSVFAADMDGDGDMDVLSASRSDDKIAWYEQLGTLPVDLGEIDFEELPGLDLTGGERAYSFITANDGYLAVDATFDPAAGEVTLRLLDDQGQLIEEVSGGGGYLRIDHTDPTGRNVYELRVTGTNPSVDLRICNLVSPAGPNVEVFGADGSDTFDFAISETYDVSVNGVEYAFDRSGTNLIFFIDHDGSDSLSITGTEGNESVKLNPGRVDYRVHGATFSVQAVGIENITVNSGGDDTAELFDSDGDDTLTATPTQMVLTGTPVGGSPFSVTANGFRYAHAYAKAGGNDGAEFVGSTAVERVKAYPEFVKLMGGDYSNRVMNAPRAADGVGRGDEYKITARGYRNVSAIADQGGTGDKAKLYDSGELGIDIWAAAYVDEETWSTMTSPSRLLYEVSAFERIGGYGFNREKGENHGTNRKVHSNDVDFVFQYGYWE